jgi:hypothetical protein
MFTKQAPFKKLHLLVSVILIVVLAGMYGFAPEKLVPALAGTSANPDVSNAFKALMGLYLGMAIVWGWGSTIRILVSGYTGQHRLHAKPGFRSGDQSHSRWPARRRTDGWPGAGAGSRHLGHRKPENLR